MHSHPQTKNSHLLFFVVVVFVVVDWVVWLVAPGETGLPPWLAFGALLFLTAALLLFCASAWNEGSRQKAVLCSARCFTVARALPGGAFLLYRAVG